METDTATIPQNEQHKLQIGQILKMRSTLALVVCVCIIDLHITEINGLRIYLPPVEGDQKTKITVHSPFPLLNFRMSAGGGYPTIVHMYT